MNCPFKRWTLKRPEILIQVFFLSLFPGCLAQLYNTDAVSIALAGCYSYDTEWSSGLSNEAALGIEKQSTFAVSHARPFVIKELGINTVGAQFPLFPGNMGLKIQYCGIPGYHQANSSLGYGLKLSDHLYAGIGFRYFNTIAQGAWSFLRAIGLSGGIMVEAGKSTKIGVHLINPFTMNNYHEYGAVFPSAITMGVGKKLYTSSNAYAEISYMSNTGLTSRFAIDYHCAGKVALRIGYHSNPPTFSCGTGIFYAPLTLDFAFAYSVRYGVCPALSIAYLVGK